MRLQDLTSVSSDYRVQTTDGKIHTLPSAAGLSAEIHKTPLRYVLDDACVRLISEAAFGQKSMLGEAIDLLRIPAERVWLEWTDRDAIQILRSAGVTVNANDQRPPRKVGILIESDESGRRGEARMLWQNGYDEAELSPFIADFDFDAAQSTSVTASRRGTERHIHFPDLPALDPFFKLIRYRLDSRWDSYYNQYCESEAQFEDTLHSGLSHIAQDLPFAAAFFLILSTRTAFAQRETSFKKLNAKRARKGRAALLDHIEIRLNLTPSDGPGASNGHDIRALPRLHHVTGHLVRRGDKLFWRRAHLRGNPSRGAVIARTINVTAGSNFRAA